MKEFREDVEFDNLYCRLDNDISSYYIRLLVHIEHVTVTSFRTVTPFSAMFYAGALAALCHWIDRIDDQSTLHCGSVGSGSNYGIAAP